MAIGDGSTSYAIELKCVSIVCGAKGNPCTLSHYDKLQEVDSQSWKLFEKNLWD
jgi:hypothetical protein